MRLANTQGCGGATPPLSLCTYNVKVTVTTDDYPSETSWDIVEQCGGSSGAGRGNYDGRATTYEDEYCLPAARFKFTLRDSFDDGICCGYGNGSYEVSLNGEVMASGGTFYSEESHEFGSCATPPSALPPISPPTLSPTTPPTQSPTLPPTTRLRSPPDHTPGPTFFTCAQFNEANDMACTRAYGGNHCQWVGDCRNCGCIAVLQHGADNPRA